jgi:acyl-CoA synthetase (AMP-forming)/AMP-acid ligase II
VTEGAAVTIGAVDSGEPVGPGESGEILVAGPQLGLGYWNDEAATAETFVTRGGTRWLRTGDIGMLKDDELYVLGRLKDVLIHRGVNIHASDLEATAHASHPALADARAAAFAVDRYDREDVVLVLELARRSIRLPDFAPLIRAVEDAVALDHTLLLHELLFVRPGTLPRTASGKVRRAEARRLYLAGALHQHRLEPHPAEQGA